jgi:hypothetical protein
MAAYLSGNDDVVWLLDFVYPNPNPDGTPGETVIADNIATTNVQTFSNKAFQVVASDSLTFDSAFRVEHSLATYAIMSNGVKLSASVMGLQNGDIKLASDELSSVKTEVILTVVDSGVIPENYLDNIVNHYNNDNTPLAAVRTIPTCFGVSNTIADLANSGSGSTATVIDATRVSVTFDARPDTPTLMYYMSLFANEPNVLFVEPTVAPHVMATTANNENGGPALSVTQGDATNVAQGLGVTRDCQYMNDRDINGNGEVIAVIDNGLLTDSTFFYGVDQNVACADTASDAGCCVFENPEGCGALGDDCGSDVVCEPTLEATTGGYGIVTNTNNRRVLNYVPHADGIAAEHGTKVTSTILGNALNDRGFSCPQEFAVASDLVRGLADGAKAVFIDVGDEAVSENYLNIPQAQFGDMLQNLAYDNNGANEVVLAWGADTGATADAITRDIDSFLVSNRDAIVVSAVGDRDGTNGNTALAKNAISVGVFSSGSTTNVRPTLSVQFSNVLYAATTPSSGDNVENYCGYSEFKGSSAAASVVAGNVALVESYLKNDALVRGNDAYLYEYNGDGDQTSTTASYTGATVRAILIAAANNNGLSEDYGNGFGVSSLDNILPFEYEHQTDVRIEQHTFAATGSSFSREITVTDAEKPLIIALAYTDTGTTPFAAAHSIVNDVRLTVTSPSTQFYPEGIVHYSNGNKDALTSATNNQKVVIPVPETGTYTITVTADFVSTANSAAAQEASLVVSGRFSVESTDSVTGQRSGEVTSTPSCCPAGTLYPTTSCFSITYLVLILIVVIMLVLALIILFKNVCRVKLDQSTEHK